MYKPLFLLLALLLAGTPSHAQITQTPLIENSQSFGDYTVHFTVFNSTFVTPAVAQIYQLTRARDRALVNISVTRTGEEGTSLGLPARIRGTATNLIQQQRALNFQEIDEGNAVYYIASLRHTNEEVMNFTIDVQPEGEDRTFQVRFTRTLHIER
jgi:hypothetical protein